MPYQCLVISHDAAMHAPAQYRRYGLRLSHARGVREALSLMRQWSFDALLMTLPALEDAGHRALRRVASAATAPLLLLTDAGEADLVRALREGASAWLACDASERLIAAKLWSMAHRRSLLERAASTDSPQAVARVGELTVDRRHGVALVSGTPMTLTRAQLDVLTVLAQRAGRTVRRGDMVVRRGDAAALDGRGADMLVSRVRQALREAGAREIEIQTRRGEGYCLVRRADNARASPLH
jgi:DNA-binding response OmpR family regulator